MSDQTVTMALLRRRKLIVALVVAATVIFMVAYNLGSWLVLTRMGRHLEQSLDARLLSILRLTTQTIERQGYDFFSSQELSLLRLQLARLRSENQLEAAYLIDDHNRVLLDSQQELEQTVSRAYLQSDSSAIHLAHQGQLTVSALHEVADNRFKNGYGPVMDLYGNSAILVLEADADFVQIMQDFYQALYLGIVISAVVLAMLTVFLIAAASLFLRTESRLYQSQRLAGLGQMAATVAHEIRNPLAIIKSTTDLLREKDQSQQVLLGYINDEVLRLNRLVTDFLSYAREPVLHKTACDLVQLINDAITRRRAAVSISWQLPHTVVMVTCDADRIRQVLDNLLLNAEQAVAADRGQIEIVLHNERIRGNLWVRVSVLDNGPGLPAHKGDLFEPFFTTKSSGVGLGLAVCKSMIERHGGRIEAVNRPEGGSEFRFYLPH